MNTFEEQRAEEFAALESQSCAFKRRKTAYDAINWQTEQPSESDIAEFEAADVNWKSASSDVERIRHKI